VSLTAIHLKQFTAFDDLRVEFSPGINVLVGTNGTGKTHLMKVAYAACKLAGENSGEFPARLLDLFLTSSKEIGELIRHHRADGRASAHVQAGAHDISVTFGGPGPEKPWFGRAIDGEEWLAEPIQTVYIPVKEWLSHAPGFRSLYAYRAIHFESTYDDILTAAYLPPLREPADADADAGALLEAHMGGTVIVRSEEFFLKTGDEEVVFALVAEGICRLGLLWLLLRNGSLRPGSVLFWDEPETNLNPQLYRPVIKTLLGLQRRGVQIILATHDYVSLKELDLQSTLEDKITYHALHRSEETNKVECNSTDSYRDIHPNAIGDTFTDLYDREVTRSLEAMER